MYECFVCHKKYKNEYDAKDCCTWSTEFDDGDYLLSRKQSRSKPVARQHICPNINHGNKKWIVWLNVDEKCPMCDFIYRPR